MPEYKMTPKRFLQKNLSGKVNSKSFLDKHLEFLQSFSFLKETIDDYLCGSLLPTPALEKCRKAIFDYVRAEELKKAQKSLEKSPKQKEKRAYTLSLHIKKYSGDKIVGSEIDEEHIYQADTFSEAQRKADNILFKQENSVQVSIINNIGKAITSVITRDEALGRVLRPKRSQVIKIMGKRSSKLGFGCKSSFKNKISFSRG